jgi:hypothetical protein
MAHLFITVAYSALLIFVIACAFLALQSKLMITCIMVTGKDASRKHFAEQAIRNFQEQTYPNKALLIINHGTYSLEAAPNVTEIRITKDEHTTLGDIRNFALEKLPLGSLWAVWDDDDYRRPDYLSKLYTWLVNSGAALVTYTSRLEYNQNTGLIWQSDIPWGSVHILAQRVPNVRYLARDTMEDVDLVNDYRTRGYRVLVKRNYQDPSIYVRLVHGTNTSLYVNPHKSSLVSNGTPSSYNEYAATAKDVEYVLQKRNALSLGIGSI